MIICQLGDATEELRRVADDPRNLYLLGSMGMVIPVALGMALSTGKQVVAVEGDGGCLMNLGALTTVARYGPKRLSILVLDNGSYGSTGGQPSATSTGADLAAIGRASGLKESRQFDHAGSEDALVNWLGISGVRLAVARTRSSPPPSERSTPRILPVENTARLTAAIGRV
ncbi:thiamine pyrophosphate-dependent enzyme [Cellulomonas wangsupingiae]|uniref:Thiamine pyrophosphate-dependent enzyme n=1 Tax=Cellulomonas wangsupingiae TaxID=2968085 RepID=A0ABY5KAZ8_9CELL|nr:thiamine pyrophosphate-dependent enzyme [Cellulomonas wangsupingiae]MCC2334737.1 thiamine pyrophosphate-dependent enzyme [Cellulomonas wangsupingiae]MCM0638543.1 thiamine pyrophosphate-dependent enzyme [Cellulomonas wangsupingiae]UUI66307.1 thiamine pyrophosphate-dependent enzyme [Cellulomonas wangsupingiae]